MKKVFAFAGVLVSYAALSSSYLFVAAQWAAAQPPQPPGTLSVSVGWSVTQAAAIAAVAAFGAWVLDKRK